MFVSRTNIQGDTENLSLSTNPSTAMTYQPELHVEGEPFLEGRARCCCEIYQVTMFLYLNKISIIMT